MNDCGESIKRMRKFCGETQEDLGNAIYAGKSTIAMYETGKRTPDIGTLMRIADHYCVSLDTLLNFDDPGFGLSNITIPIGDLSAYREIVLPLVSSKKAMKDEYFAKAYGLQQSLWKEPDPEQMKDKKYDEMLPLYSASFTEHGTIESCANLLPVFISLKIHCHYPWLRHVVMNDTANKYKFDEAVRKCLLTDGSNQMIAQPENMMEMSEESGKIIDYILERLSKKGRYTEFVDYYKALRYCFGIADETMKTGDSILIGCAMMRENIRLHNRYSAYLDDESDDNQLYIES